MTNTAATPEVTQYAAQYELLRAQVVGTVSEIVPGREAQPPRGIGLALLLREGMPGWLQAVTQILTAALAQTPTGAGGRQGLPTLPTAGAAAPAREAREDPRFCTILPAAQRHNVTILLASLVLSTRRLAGLSPKPEYSPCQ